jgi:hypothetical protein
VGKKTEMLKKEYFRIQMSYPEKENLKLCPTIAMRKKKNNLKTK